jgi:hypothetical protein
MTLVTLDYIKRKWLFLLIVLILLLLNIWVWFLSDTKKEIKPSGDFVETKKMVLMK